MNMQAGMMGQSPSGEMMRQQNSGMDEKIRQAAQQALTPQELQIVAQSVNPQFIQVMAKLFGDQAVMLLTPLVNLQAQPLQNDMAAQSNPLDSFNADQYPTPVNFGRGRP